MNIVESNFHALSNYEIRNLDGGNRRGEWLLFEVELGPVDRMWVSGRLRNQYQSQFSPKHPDGWEPICAPGFENELRYDLASGTLELPVAILGRGGMLEIRCRCCPAKVYRCQNRSEIAKVKGLEARRWRARFQLLSAIRHNWNDAPVIGTLMAEKLDPTWRERTEGALATRLIIFAYALEEQVCKDLTSLLAVVPQALHLAA